MKLSKVRTAEEIIARFKDGQIIERGTPQELLRQPGLFRQIYDMQMAIGEEAET